MNTSPVALIAGVEYDPFSDFEKKQNALIGELPSLNPQIDATQALLENTQQRVNLFNFANDISRYTGLKNSGLQKEADQMLVSKLWHQNGDLLRQFAPTIYADLFPTDSTQLNRSALGRLNDAELAVFKTVPEFRINTKDAIEDGVKALQMIKGGNDRYFEKKDITAVRDLAFASIESSAGTKRIGTFSREMDNKLNEFSSLLKAASSGRKYEGLVQDMKGRAGEMSTILDKVTDADRTAITADIKEIEKALAKKGEGEILDKQAREGLEQRLKNFKEMSNLMDPTSQEGKQVRDMLKEVQSGNFRADTLGNWLRTNGPKYLAITAAMALTVAACFSAGATSPLAIIAWSSVAGLAAEELTVYGLSKYNEGKFSGWGVEGEKNIYQKWAANTDKGTTEENISSFIKEVAGAYAGRVLFDTGLGLLTMGATKFLFSGLSPSSLALASLRQVIAGEGKALPMIAYQAQRAALLAEGRSAAGLFVKTLMKNTSNEFLMNGGFTVAQVLGETAIHDVTPEQWKKTLEDQNQAVSFSLGTSLSMFQGLLQGVHAGGGRVTHFQAKSPHAEAAFIKNYAREGFRVQAVEPGRWNVWPPNAPKNAAPFVLQRGTGEPPLRVFPEGYKASPHAQPHMPEISIAGRDGQPGWKQSETGAKALSEVGSFTDHFSNGRFAEALAVADNAYPPGHEVNKKPIEATAESLQSPETLRKFLRDMGDLAGVNSHKPVDGNPANVKYSTDLPLTVIEVAPGVKVDLVTGKTPSGKSLEGANLAKFENFAKSEAGQRILAEHALIAMEEKVHLRNYQNKGQILSPSYAKFARDMGAPGTALEKAFFGKRDARYADSEGRPPFTYEQEAILALHDARPDFWTADMINRHFGEQHATVRQPVVEWLRQQERAKATGSDAPSGAGNDSLPARSHPGSHGDGAPLVEPPGGHLGRNPQFDPELRRIERQGTTNFLIDFPVVSERKNSQRAQQDIFKHINETLQAKPSPGEPSLAEQGWSVYQARKDSAADAAKMDYILVNENSGQYHVLDATAQDKNLKSEIRKNSIIQFKDNVSFDPASGLLMEEGRRAVREHIQKMAKKESPLNLRDHPPPGFDYLNPGKSVQELVDYRKLLASSPDADVRIFHGELFGALQYWKGSASQTKAEFKPLNESFQEKADIALKQFFREFIAPGSNKLSGKPSADDRNRTSDVDRSGKLSLKVDDFRFEWEPSKAKAAYEKILDQAIEKARTDGNKSEESRLRTLKQAMPEPDVLAKAVAKRLTVHSNKQLFGRNLHETAPSATHVDAAPPNPHETAAVKSLLDLNSQLKYQANDAEFSPDIKELLKLNLYELQEAHAKGAKDGLGAVDSAQKLMNDYRADNPDAVVRINELLRAASDGDPKPTRLGRNETKVEGGDSSISSAGETPLPDDGAGKPPATMEAFAKSDVGALPGEVMVGHGAWRIDPKLGKDIQAFGGRFVADLAGNDVNALYSRLTKPLPKGFEGYETQAYKPKDGAPDVTVMDLSEMTSLQAEAMAGDVQAQRDLHSIMQNHMSAWSKTETTHFKPGTDGSPHIAVVPQLKVEIIGATLINGKPNKIQIDLVSGKPVDMHPETPLADRDAAVSQAEKFRDSSEGKRLVTEAAMLAAEARLSMLMHINKNKIVSPSYARFLHDTRGNLATSDATSKDGDPKRKAETIEHELIFLLHDSGLPLKQIEQHFANDTRTPAIQYLKGLAALNEIPDPAVRERVKKTIFDSGLATDQPTETHRRQRLIEALPELASQNLLHLFEGAGKTNQLLKDYADRRGSYPNRASELTPLLKLPINDVNRIFSALDQKLNRTDADNLFNTQIREAAVAAQIETVQDKTLKDRLNVLHQGKYLDLELTQALQKAHQSSPEMAALINHLLVKPSTDFPQNATALKNLISKDLEPALIQRLKQGLESGLFNDNSFSRIASATADNIRATMKLEASGLLKTGEMLSLVATDKDSAVLLRAIEGKSLNEAGLRELMDLDYGHGHSVRTMLRASDGSAIPPLNSDSIASLMKDRGVALDQALNVEAKYHDNPLMAQRQINVDKMIKELGLADSHPNLRKFIHEDIPAMSGGGRDAMDNAKLKFFDQADLKPMMEQLDYLHQQIKANPGDAKFAKALANFPDSSPIVAAYMAGALKHFPDGDIVVMFHGSRKDFVVEAEATRGKNIDEDHKSPKAHQRPEFYTSSSVRTARAYTIETKKVGTAEGGILGIVMSRQKYNELKGATASENNPIFEGEGVNLMEGGLLMLDRDLQGSQPYNIGTETIHRPASQRAMKEHGFFFVYPAR